MNTETIVHPNLHHYGLITADLDPMVDWYRKVLGMTVDHRSKIPAVARMTHRGPPFSALAFISNDEMDHRIVFFEIPKATTDPDRRHHTGLQHVAFECTTIDDLLGTYVRLKNLGIPLLWAADHGPGISIYYGNPDRNVVEMFFYNYGSPWTATEYLRTGQAGRPAQIDPDKLVAARASWTLFAGVDLFRSLLPDHRARLERTLLPWHARVIPTGRLRPFLEPLVGEIVDRHLRPVAAIVRAPRPDERHEGRHV